MDPQTTVDTDDLSQQCEEHLAPLWAKIAREPRYPARTSEVLSLVGAAEYECSRRFVQHLFDNGHLAKPPRGDGNRLEWTPLHIMALFHQLEIRAKWQPFSERHAAKKSPFQLVLEGSDSEGKAMVQEEIANTSVDEFLDAIAQSPHEAGRKLIHALRMKLEQLKVATDADSNDQ